VEGGGYEAAHARGEGEALMKRGVIRMEFEMRWTLEPILSVNVF
jgi:hypothetical protein